MEQDEAVCLGCHTPAEGLRWATYPSEPWASSVKRALHVRPPTGRNYTTHAKSFPTAMLYSSHSVQSKHWWVKFIGGQDAFFTKAEQRCSQTV